MLGSTWETRQKFLPRNRRAVRMPARSESVCSLPHYCNCPKLEITHVSTTHEKHRRYLVYPHKQRPYRNANVRTISLWGIMGESPKQNFEQKKSGMLRIIPLLKTLTHSQSRYMGFDVIIVVTVWGSDWTEACAACLGAGEFVHLLYHCLLYTSPSPRDTR